MTEQLTDKPAWLETYEDSTGMIRWAVHSEDGNRIDSSDDMWPKVGQAEKAARAAWPGLKVKRT